METKYDVAIIGGGVMGLLTAYRLSHAGQKVIVLEAGKIGGPQAASSGITRSIRNDYEDEQMAVMAYAGFRDWQELEKEWGIEIIDSCGCLNIYNPALTTVKLADSYAAKSAGWLDRDSRSYQVFDSESSIVKRYPQIAAEYAVLDEAAGVAMPSRIMSRLVDLLRVDPRVKIMEDSRPRSIKRDRPTGFTIQLPSSLIRARKLVVTAGLGTVQICRLIEGRATWLPISPARPFELKYFLTEDRRYNSEKLPVFAFLDVGIYGHPFIDGLTEGVKIGYYHPPGVKVAVDDSLSFIDRFVATCLPGLKESSKSRLITDVDQCSYDMTPDNRFIMGYLGDGEDVVVAAGFNGTGFKFAPVVAETVVKLVEETKPDYDIRPYDPNRFTMEGQPLIGEAVDNKEGLI